jgi:hypothetical protein
MYSYMYILASVGDEAAQLRAEPGGISCRNVMVAAHSG